MTLINMLYRLVLIASSFLSLSSFAYAENTESLFFFHTRLEELEGRTALLLEKIEALEYRQSQLEKNLITSPKEPSTALEKEKAITEEEKEALETLYNQSMEALQAHHIEEAQTLLQDFIRQAADHPFRQSAEYWLAETFYIQKAYQKAALHFAEAHQHPGPYAPDALLKLALCMQQLQKPVQACQVLAKLLRPDAYSLTNAIREQALRLSGSLACSAKK